MRSKLADKLIFMAVVGLLSYQFTLLYLGAVTGTRWDFALTAGTLLFGLLLGRSVYLIVASILSFVSMSAGALMLVMPLTRELFFWSAIALLTVTPATAILTYLIDHRLLKRRAIGVQLTRFKAVHPLVDVVTGVGNRQALVQDLQRDKQLTAHNLAYSWTLTLVKIDFLESVVNFLGNRRFHELLHSTAQHLRDLQLTADQVYYLGDGRFVVRSPMLTPPAAHAAKEKVAVCAEQLAQEFQLNSHALVLRTGQVSSTQVDGESVALRDLLAWMERRIETDVTKEYL